MSHSFDSATGNSSYAWYYPPMGPPPPTPFVVNTIPDYFGGRPSPPPSPPRTRTTFAIDDYTPCPPTPRCVPSCVHGEMQDDLEATVLTDSRSISKQWSNRKADETKGHGAFKSRDKQSQGPVRK